MAAAACSSHPWLSSCALSRSRRQLSQNALGLSRSPPRLSSVRLHCISSSTTANNEEAEEDEEKKAFEKLEQYVELNRGSWSGTFTQYDCLGKVLACVPVKLKANVFGKGEHLSLYQTLCVKQAQSSTSVSGDTEEAQWMEFNIADLDSVTMNQRHKVGYFGDEKAYCLSHLTAKMLDVVLRTGLLGEDDDEEKDYFPGVRLPCRRPALVSESCMFSASGDSRVRAFHVLNSQGLLDMIGVFHERKDGAEEAAAMEDDDELTGVEAILGEWSGRAFTQRTGMYGFTIAEEDLIVSIEKNKDEIMQTTCRRKEDDLEKSKLVVEGTVCGNLLKFTDGLQTSLLPGGLSITCPISVGNCVQRSRSFFLEFARMDSVSQRRRLVRTYDATGVVVSTTMSVETRNNL